MLVSGDEGQVHFRGLRGGKLDLRLLSCFLQELKGQLVLGKVNAFLFLEAFGQIFDDLRIEVLAAQERVAVGRFNLENAIADFKVRNVVGYVAKYTARVCLAISFFLAIGQRRVRLLMSDGQTFKTL